MRIVDRKTFLTLPAGTVYAKFSPHMFSETCIKDDTIRDIDWYYVGLDTPVDADSTETWSDTLFRAMKTGENVALDFDTVSRDGLFDADQLFAVWDHADVSQLINRLQQALRDQP